MMRVLGIDPGSLTTGLSVVTVAAPPRHFLRVARAFMHTELRGAQAGQAVNLIGALEQLDDAQNVFTNAAFAGE
ncbi:MAG: hypothetical protein OD918_05940 [Gammaproteobacteria bacterium]